ncbi:hypothetical protein Hte_005670 [Hypoxylon texense]
MQLKVVKDTNGSILGKIPIVNNMSSRHNTSAGANSRTHPTHNVRRRRSHENLRAEERPRYVDRAVQTDAIEDYREHALSSRSPRATGSQRRRSERRDTHERGNHRSYAASNPSHGTTDCALDEDAAGHMVERYLKEDAAKNTRQHIDEHESFFPMPKVTFLIDQPRRLTCQICLETSLKIGISSHERSKKDLSILPCGHVACSGCMETWVEQHRTCPFCRKRMKRDGCRHPAKPVRIAYDNIQTLPMTLARGGKIAKMCRSCADRDSREVTMGCIMDMAQGIRVSRRVIEERGSAADKEELAFLESTIESYSIERTLELINKRAKEW